MVSFKPEERAFDSQCLNLISDMCEITQGIQCPVHWQYQENVTCPLFSKNTLATRMILSQTEISLKKLTNRSLTYRVNMMTPHAQLKQTKHTH
jgi:hypothetical protein